MESASFTVTDVHLDEDGAITGVTALAAPDTYREVKAWAGHCGDPVQARGPQGRITVELTTGESMRLHRTAELFEPGHPQFAHAQAVYDGLSRIARIEQDGVTLAGIWPVRVHAPLDVV